MESLSILVVDDEPGLRAGIQRELQHYIISIPESPDTLALEIAQAENGDEALRQIEICAPTIMFLDYKMPGLSGLEVMERVRQSHPDIIIIMMTAYASIETVFRATKQGAFDFLPKPFKPTALKQTLNKAAAHALMISQTRRLAEEKRQIRFELISVLAHELKAPLAAVEGYVQIVKDHTAGDDPAVYDEMMQRCLQRTEYMRKMILDLLDLTRIESGRKEREIAKVDMGHIVKEAFKLYEKPAKAHGIALHYQGEDDLSFYGDKGELALIINNLVSNAIKYNHDNGEVCVSLHRVKGSLEIQVRDTGIGLEKSEQEHIFELFFRAKNPRTVGILGSGLGLSIIDKLVQVYQGKIEVESQADQGSLFRIRLQPASLLEKKDVELIAE